MKRILVLAGVLLLGVAPEDDERTHQERMRGLLVSAADGDWEAVLAAIEPSLTGEGFTELQVAEAYYARGFFMAQLAPAAESLAPEDPAADPVNVRLAPLGDFEQTRTLAGPGALRLAAIYGLGWVHLSDGEAWRAQIPEISAAQPGAQSAAPGAALPGMPPSGGAAAADEEDAPDPLEEARAGYVRAKEWFVERLRADWRDADTRANLELIQRRLAELDAIEEERERQQQEQEQQDQEGNEEQDQDEGEDGEEGEQKDDQEGSSPKDQETPQDPEEGEPQEQPQEEPGQEGEDKPQPHEGPPEERHLTREEVMRLLDRLSEMEDEYRAFQEAMRAARRIPVERDW